MKKKKVRQLSMEEAWQLTQASFPKYVRIRIKEISLGIIRESKDASYCYKVFEDSKVVSEELKRHFISKGYKIIPGSSHANFTVSWEKNAHDLFQDKLNKEIKK